MSGSVPRDEHRGRSGDLTYHFGGFLNRGYGVLRVPGPDLCRICFSTRIREREERLLSHSRMFSRTDVKSTSCDDRGRVNYTDISRGILLYYTYSA